ncbi:TadE/TadG family protein [Tsuneonella sp. CC-YZS046]|uniref:TadE/TadG family protein n=1 Tax=Tsuneonella sp. CC-YZS046 TaxID=3042152 RepID=UPI002D788235|nr:TadE/TadG family protein [Tsuneonella sp. CC-YZS046]WRO67774.1 TadE/TadG family protein [Tsuneonella sp. CC-YZS046]
MTQRGEFREGLFKRLIEDRAGNTLAIVAASTLPMMAIIGGGVDISRAYMAKTQLQSACDAGVLAGRRAMSKTSEYGEDEKDKANAMFDFNFDADAVQADDITFESDDNDDGQVLGTATATVPTAIMKIFGKTEIELQVDCMAELQLANVDVMFVLDTTGSMSGSKIEGLRDAVRDFHATLATAVTDAETRVRYGFVPYSMTVNVSELISTGTMPLSYIADEGTYQSRTALFDTSALVGVPETPVNTTEWYGGADKIKISSSNCTNYGKNTFPSGSGGTPINSGGPAPADTIKTEYSYGGRGSESGSNKSCWRNVKTTTTSYHTKYEFTKWKYAPITLDTSDFKTGSSVKLVSESSSALNSAYVDTPGWYDTHQLARKTGVSGTGVTGVTTRSVTWGGCIEEADTVETDDFNPVPDEAYDLHINLEPDSLETRWKPIWSDATFMRSNKSGEYYDGRELSLAYPINPDGKNSNGSDDKTYTTSIGENCPAPMKLFQTIDLSSTTVPTWLNTYLNNLVAVGNTYHDIGMIWGGRLGSSRGIFSDNVNEGIDDGSIRSVSRHLIFMTDGKMEPTLTGYSAYGIEKYANKIAPRLSSTSTVTSRHNLRFRAACDAAKAEGYIIYVVAFGTTVSNDMKYCSSDNRWYYSDNTASLRNTFKFIASQVADLRLGA